MTENLSYNSELQTLSTLQHIASIAQHLLEPHIIQFLNDHSGLQALITSACNNLQNCVANINAQAPVSSLPIDVLSLVFQEVHNDELQTSRHPLSRALLNTQPASRTLHIHLCNVAAPLLEWFFLEVPDLSREQLPVFTLGAPLLSYIHLSWTSTRHWRLPLHHITMLHLQATHINLGECVNVASQCPLLETLAIYGGFQVTEMEPSILPHLRSLELYNDGYMPLAALLQAFSAPCLESLVITPFDVAGWLPEENSDSKRFTTLKSVTLAPSARSIQELLQLASQYFPNVVDVSLIGSLAESDTLIRGLQDTDDEGNIIFPNMRTLALRNLGYASEESLWSLLSYRYLSDSPLHTLYLDKVSIQQMSGLRQLQEKIEVVELDKWSLLRRGSLLCDEEDDRFYPW
jgi:hypothetical protein